MKIKENSEKLVLIGYYRGLRYLALGFGIGLFTFYFISRFIGLFIPLGADFAEFMAICIPFGIIFTIIGFSKCIEYSGNKCIFDKKNNNILFKKMCCL